MNRRLKLCPIDPELDEAQYVRRLLDHYRETPTTAGYVRRADRQLAGQLYRRGVPLRLVEAAFALAATRRLFRPHHAPRLNPVRSLHYFLPVIEELMEEPPDPEYVRYLEFKLRHLGAFGVEVPARIRRASTPEACPVTAWVVVIPAAGGLA